MALPFQPIPTVARLTIRIQGPQLQVMSCHTYWRLTTPAAMTALEVKGLADQCDTAMLAQGIIVGTINQSCEYLGSNAQALDAVDAPQHFSNANAASGGVVANMLPLEVAVVFSFNSGLRGRSHRNRWYWPNADIGMLDSSPKDGLFQASVVSTYHLVFGEFFAAVAGTAFEQVVASPKLGTADPMTSFIVRRRPGSQRRREP